MWTYEIFPRWVEVYQGGAFVKAFDYDIVGNDAEQEARDFIAAQPDEDENDDA